MFRLNTTKTIADNTNTIKMIIKIIGIPKKFTVIFGNKFVKYSFVDLLLRPWLQVFRNCYQSGTVFGWSDAIAAFELLAQVRSRKAYLTGNLGNGHFRVIREEIISLLHADGIDELGKGHAVSIG